MNLKQVKKPKKLQEADKLLLLELNKIIKTSTDNFDKYEYSRCKNDTDNFFWNIFTDNYLEVVKNRVYNGTKEEKDSAFYTLYQSLLTILKLMSPFTPYITEYLYQEYFRKHEKDKSIHISSWPEEFKVKESKKDSEIFSMLLEIISKVRQKKSEKKKSVKAEINLYLLKSEQDKLKDVLEDLKSVLSVKELKTGKFKVEFI